MATLTLTQTRTNEPSGVYRVVNTITNAVGIPPEILVVDNDTVAFNHVANVWELDVLPTTQTVGSSFYRVATHTRDFDDVAAAVSFAGDLKRRVDVLIDEYTIEADAFAGSEDTNYPLP